MSSNWNNPLNPLTGDGDVTLIILDDWLGDGTDDEVLVDELSSVVDGELIVAVDVDAVVVLDVWLGDGTVADVLVDELSSVVEGELIVAGGAPVNELSNVVDGELIVVEGSAVVVLDVWLGDATVAAGALVDELSVVVDGELIVAELVVVGAVLVVRVFVVYAGD